METNIDLRPYFAQIEELTAQKAQLAAALAELDSYLDFGEPLSHDKPWIFTDFSGINAAFEKARAALEAAGNR